MLSTRGLRLHASRGAIYEFEDVVRRCEDVDLIAPEGDTRVFKVSNRLANRVARLVPSVPSFPGRSIKVDRDYELFVFFCQSANDILLLNSLKGWRDRCQYAVCWLDELWSKDVDSMRQQLSRLAGFDRIVMNFESSRSRVEKVAEVPVVPMPFGVDTIRFRPHGPDRPIDVLNVGRRSEVTHTALRATSDSGEFFYYFDTLASLETSRRGGHRELYSNLAKRSRYSIVNKAKFNLAGGQNPHDEVGPRFYEGMAAGTVMLGVPPRCSTFTENFDWADAVIEIPFDCPDIIDVIADLDRRPDRLAELRVRNVHNALTRHDWIYRWETVVGSVGLQPSDRVGQRKERLAALSEESILSEESMRSDAAGGMSTRRHHVERTASTPLATSRVAAPRPS